MLINKLIIILYINFSYQKITKNGVYNIANNNLNLYRKGKNISLSEYFDYPYSFYRIIKSKANKSENFYNIEAKETHYKLSYLENKEVTFNSNVSNSELWKLIQINENNLLYILLINI